MNTLTTLTAAGLVAAAGLVGITACTPNAQPTRPAAKEAPTQVAEPALDIDDLTEIAWNSIGASSQQDICNLWNISPDATRSMFMTQAGDTYTDMGYTDAEAWASLQTRLYIAC